MKAFILFSILMAFKGAYAQMECIHRKPNISNTWIDMVDTCVEPMRKQILTEVGASMQYLAMGAHFSRDQINRLGFAEHFFKAASEEREHAIHLIKYLLMRGQLTSKVSSLIPPDIPVNIVDFNSGIDALRTALKLEAEVTKSIRNVIIQCETPPDKNEFNDYHLVDYLTGTFLEEQYKGQAELATHVSKLDKLMASHGALGEFIYDKQLLSA